MEPVDKQRTAGRTMRELRSQRLRRVNHQGDIAGFAEQDPVEPAIVVGQADPGARVRVIPTDDLRPRVPIEGRIGVLPHRGREGDLARVRLELAANGRWTTQGILFESGKSDLKPESTPTLKAIAAALKGHPDLKVEIQGHTDNVGSAASNLTLSQSPPLGTPNYFLSTWEFTNALTVYKFHVDWNRISLSTFTGPDIPIAASSWPNAAVPNAPSQGGNALDADPIPCSVTRHDGTAAPTPAG